MAYQNINQYNFRRWGIRPVNEITDICLASDEKDYDQEVIFSPLLIGEDDGNRMPFKFDFNSTGTTICQSGTCTFDNDVIVSENYWNPDDIDPNFCPKVTDLCDVGLTGIDNGLVKQMSGETIQITTGLYTNNTDKYSRYKYDRRMKLHPITGFTTTQNRLWNDNSYSYDLNYSTNGGPVGYFARLNGGFFQGFYKIPGYDYQIFPQRVPLGWTAEFMLRYRWTGDTSVGLNNRYPNNKGTFFYMGSRAENKFYHYADGEPKQDTGYTRVTSGLTCMHTCGCASSANTSSDCLEVYQISGGTSTNCNCGCPCNCTVNAKYPEKDPLYDGVSNGLSIRLSGDSGNPRVCIKTYRITGGCETSGTCLTGLTYQTGTSVTEWCSARGIFDECKNTPYINVEHWVQIDAVFQRNQWLDTCDLYEKGGLGLLVDTIYTATPANNSVSLIEPPLTHELPYDPATTEIVTFNDNWTEEKKYRLGTLKIFVNGKLFMVAENFEEIIPRLLDVQKEKQIGVGYNISIGGGTQGLKDNLTFSGGCPETISGITYQQDPECLTTHDLDNTIYSGLTTHIKLEEYFGGSLIGDISAFRMYVEPLNASQVKHNFRILKNKYTLLNPECPDCAIIIPSDDLEYLPLPCNDLDLLPLPCDDLEYDLIPCPTVTPTQTPTQTQTPTLTPTQTQTQTQTPTATLGSTPTVTPTQTPTNSGTPTQTVTPTNTETPTLTPTPTNTETPTLTPTPTNTETPTQTVTPSLTATTGLTPTATETPTTTPTTTPTETPTQTPTPTPTLPDEGFLLQEDYFMILQEDGSGIYIEVGVPTPTPTPTFTPTPTNTETPTPTPTNTETPTNTSTPTNTPTPTSAAIPNFIVSVSQVGPDVVWSGSGSFNLAALSLVSSGSNGSAFSALAGIWAIGPTTSVQRYGGASLTGYSTTFGNNLVVPTPTSSGSTFGITVGGVTNRVVIVPSGYTSNTVISGTATYPGATIASMGLTPGTYTWAWGSGVNSSSIVMTIEGSSVSPTPTPTNTTTPSVTPTNTSTPTVTPTNTTTPTNTNTPTATSPIVGSGLVLYYDPSNSQSYPGSGTTLFDLTSNALNGTMSNLTFTSPYLTYNGSTSQVLRPDALALEPGAGDFSVEVWVKYDVVTGQTRTFLSKTDNGGGAADWGYGFRTSTISRLYFEVGNGTTSTTSPQFIVSANTWYQVVGVWTNVATNSIALYINGVSQGSNAHAFATVKNTSRPLYLGNYNGNEFAQQFDGDMGVVRYYNKSLTASEVLQNFNADKSKYGL